MDKHGKPPKKPQPKAPVLAAGPFPSQEGGSGKQAGAGNDRKTAGKTNPRGR